MNQPIVYDTGSDYLNINLTRLYHMYMYIYIEVHLYIYMYIFERGGYEYVHVHEYVYVYLYLYVYVIPYMLWLCLNRRNKKTCFTWLKEYIRHTKNEAVDKSPLVELIRIINYGILFKDIKVLASIQFCFNRKMTEDIEIYKREGHLFFLIIY